MSNFKPAWWLRGKHSQTLWPSLFRHAVNLKLEWERLELPDGDFVDLCWNGKEQGPLVVIFHGLEGSIHSPYANGIMNAINKMGWRSVFMHFRGCSNEPNRLARSYHSGDTGDIHFLMQTLRQRHKGIPIFAVGYSLGANALLKYLGEHDKEEHPDAAVAVSVPFVLSNSARKLEHGFSRIYQKYLLKQLQGKVLRKFRNKTSPFPLEKVKHLNTFYKFDDEITAKLHGFKDVHDYYSRSSSRQFLKTIKKPTLILHSIDDPFMTPEAIPDESELSERVQLEICQYGGHVGFISGMFPWHPIYWLEQRIPGFFTSVIKANGN